MQVNVGNWSLVILRQGAWDWWSLVCALAAGVLLSYAIGARVWRGADRVLRLGLIGAGVGGTALVLGTPALRTPWVGLGWTFTLLVILSTTFYLNLKPQLGGRRMGVLLSLRVAALALLVPMLFEPVVRYVSRPKPDKPLMFVVDTSGSMSFPDVQNGPTRLQSVWQTLRPLVEEVEQHFVTSYFVFDSGFEPLEEAAELATRRAEGQATDIAGAVAKAFATTRRGDAAVVLISDGIDNTSPNVVEAVRGTLRPVHTVRVGSEQAESAALANIAVVEVDAGDDLIVGQETVIKATVRSSALANRVVDVKLARVDEDGKVTGEVRSKPLVLQGTGEGQVVELGYRAEQVGVQRLAVWVDPVPGERSTVDNRQEYQGLAIDPRVKVLYIEGRARPEYRELNRALGRDANVEIASLLRIQGDRFAASGTVDGEPFTAMPTRKEQWKRFDVIILGDLDSSFLPGPQQELIEQVVSEGAGLLMIGGQNSFGPGGYGSTAIERALPVFTGGLDAAQETTPFVPRLTEAGRMHPAMEGLGEWFGGGAEGGTLPPLRGNVVVQRSKSGAQVLLVHEGRPGPDGGSQIVLAVQQYGQGRSAAFTADTTYLWYLPLRGLGQDSPYNRFWGQLVRWLAGADVKNRQQGAGLETLLDKSVYELGQSVRVRAMVRDERGDATRYAQVTATLRRAGEQSGEGEQFPMTPTEGRTGMFEATLRHPDKGQWEVEIVASKEGRELGRQRLSFEVIPPADELLKLAANPELLAEIATATGGYHYSLAQLPVLLEQLMRTQLATQQATQRTVPLHNAVRMAMALVGRAPEWPKRYDLPMQGLLVVGLLAGEWVLRRKWQVA